MSSANDIHISNSVITTTPAGSATVVLWDSTADPGLGTTLARRRAFPRIKRAVVRIYMDQAATFLAQDLAKNSTTWRTFNNSGSGDAITANTWFERDVLLVGDDHRLEVTTGTVPTVWEVSVRLSEDRPLGQ